MDISLAVTIQECIENAPPEHLELVLTALIEARFTVWPKETNIKLNNNKNLHLGHFQNRKEALALHDKAKDIVFANAGLTEIGFRELLRGLPPLDSLNISD